LMLPMAIFHHVNQYGLGWPAIDSQIAMAHAAGQRSELIWAYISSNLHSNSL
jgi:hypothetical protein